MWHLSTPQPRPEPQRNSPQYHHPVPFGRPMAAPSNPAPRGGVGSWDGPLEPPHIPLPADILIPGTAFPHPALMLCLLIVILIMAVVTPACGRSNDSPGLPRGVIGAVFCKKRGEMFPFPSAASTAPSHGRARRAPACSRAVLLWVGNRRPACPRQMHANPERPAGSPAWDGACRVRGGGENTGTRGRGTRGEGKGMGAHPRRGNRL